VEIERLRYLGIGKDHNIKIISGTRKRNRYFFYKFYTRTRRVRRRKNTKRILKKGILIGK